MNESPPSAQSLPEQAFLRWDHADTYQYYVTTGEQLQLLLADFDSVVRELVDCNADISSFENIINSVYNQTVHILRDSSMRTVPLRTKNFYKFWWNQELDCLKEQAIIDH